MKNRRFLFIIALLLLFPFSACEKQNTDDPPGDPVPLELTLSEKALSESSNQFSFDIFNQILGSKSSIENIMISPMSISYALSMTLNGAAGETRTAMMEALRTGDLTLDEINNSYRTLSDKITTVDKRVIMSIANSVWVEDRLDVKQEFIDALVNYFNAEGHQFNINDPDIVDKVNKWISDNTNGKIEEMIDEIPSDVVMLLINAIYFNGKWRMQFDTDETLDKPFYLANGGSVDVDMMYQKNNFKISCNDRLCLVELPYGQGNFVMDVILPAEGLSTADILDDLTDAKFNQLLETAYEREINIYMPRFKYEYKIELGDVLSAMGMGVAFTGAADFSNIADAGLAISKVLHQTFIDNKEEGTEAAAATVVMIELTSLPPEPQTINLNRPFYYIIRESSTNSIIFMGLTGNPAAD
ncbi:MAG: serpin family protein [Bacteroidales bacterium]|nr:serpin family protein [Bacteroidales bacterium]